MMGEEQNYMYELDDKDKYVLVVYREDFKYCPHCGETESLFLNYATFRNTIKCEKCGKEFPRIDISGKT